MANADGTRIALAGQPGNAGVWDTTTWTRLSSAPGAAVLTFRAFVSDDGTLAAAQATDGRIHIWDALDGATSATLQVPDWDIQNVIVNAPSRRELVTSLSGQVIVFDYAALHAGGAELVTLAEQREPRELTEAERATYLHEGETD
jgi:WD40 repeat protein